MARRLIEIRIPESRRDDLVEVVGGIEEHPVDDVWHQALGEGEIQVTVLVDAQHSEAVLDEVEERFAGVEGFRAVILSVEASVPRPEPEEPAEGEESSEGVERVSRAELTEDVREMSTFTPTFAVLMSLATVVAVIGLLLDNVAIIIGSMVIAPFLGPSVGLALSTTLVDRDLAVESAKALAFGLAVGTAIAAALGVVLPVDPSIRQLEIRASVSLFDIALGLAVGAAGTLSVTTGVAAALVGVMVAVALLPPLAAFGLFLGSGELGLAIGALLLLAAYLICINLAGVLTFVAQGIRPRRWWEAERARRATLWAAGVWVLLLGTLVAIMWWVGLI